MTKNTEVTTTWTEGPLSLTVQQGRVTERVTIGATATGVVRSQAEGLSLSPGEARTLYTMLDEYLHPPPQAAPSGGDHR